MMYISQIIMLYTLKLFSDVYQLYLHKNGRKKKEESGKYEGERFRSINRVTGFTSVNRFESRLTPNRTKTRRQ